VKDFPVSTFLSVGRCAVRWGKLRSRLRVLQRIVGGEPSAGASERESYPLGFGATPNVGLWGGAGVSASGGLSPGR